MSHIVMYRITIKDAGFEASVTICL